MADFDFYQRLTEVYTLENRPLLLASAVSYIVGYLQYAYVIRLTLREGRGPMPFWMHSFYLAHDSTWSYLLGGAAARHGGHWFLRGTSTALLVWTGLELWCIHRAVLGGGAAGREASFSAVLGKGRAAALPAAAAYAAALQLGMYAVVLLGVEFMGEGCVMQWFCFTNVLIVLGPTHHYLRAGTRRGLSLGFCLVNVVGTVWTFAPFSFFVLAMPEVFDNATYYAAGCILTFYSIGCFWVVARYPAKTRDMDGTGRGQPIW